HLLGATLLFLAFRTIAFPALGFNGLDGACYSASFSLVFAAFLSGVSLTSAAGKQIDSGLLVAFWMPPGTGRPGRLAADLGALALDGLAVTLALSVSRMDWNFLFQKVSSLLIWVGALRIFFSGSNKGRPLPSPTGRLLTCALVMLPVYRTWEVTRI